MYNRHVVSTITSYLGVSLKACHENGNFCSNSKIPFSGLHKNFVFALWYLKYNTIIGKITIVATVNVKTNKLHYIFDGNAMLKLI